MKLNKTEIIISLKSMIENSTNATKTNALKTMLLLTIKYLDNDHSYYLKDTPNNNINMGDLAEYVIYKYIWLTFSNVEAHKKSTDPFDIKINGEKIELKSVILNNGHETQRPMKMFILLLQGKKKGLYLVDKEKSKLMLKVRPNRLLTETNGNRWATLQELLSD